MTASTDPVVDALNAAFAADRSEPRAMVRLAKRVDDGRMRTWVIVVTKALERRADGRLIVAAYEAYNDPYLKRDQPASRPYVLTADQETKLLEQATTYQRRFAVSEGSGLRRGKAHG